MRVYSYQPDDGARHCRDGVAVDSRFEGRRPEYPPRNGETYPPLIDTYWGGMGQDSHVLTPTERVTAVLLFDTGNYDELDQHKRASREWWMKHKPEDRRYIPSQHGLILRYFLRKGAGPDRATMIQNAREALEKAESEARSAQSRVEYARTRLTEVMEP